MVGIALILIGAILLYLVFTGKITSLATSVSGAVHG